jgi:beta-lactamase superfamily II metal-dependent hydrolase
MFKVKSLPARFGDAFLIEYGDPQSPHLLLIDGGTGGTRQDIKDALKDLPADRRRLDLLVISHIDRDHLEGVLTLFEEGDPGFAIEDVWFNGWPHLPQNRDDEFFGALQGEKLTEQIVKHHLPWNKAFDGKAVVVPAGDARLPQKTLAGGLQITLLSPTLEALADLRPVWEQEVRKANLDPGFSIQPNDEVEDEEEESFGAQELPDVVALSQSAFDRDRSEANDSSIAFIAEFEGKRVLFGADAHADKVLASLNRLSPNQRVKLDLFKVSHHGSQGTTNADLLRKVDCSTYLFSTNGSIYKHPDGEVIARLLKDGGPNPTFIFNYRSLSNKIWDTELLKTTHGYHTRYPAEGDNGIEIEL